MRFSSLLILLLMFSSCGNLVRIQTSKLDKIPFEIDRNRSADYNEIVSYYKSLGESSKYVQVNNFGMTDAGEPLQEVIIDRDRKFTPVNTRNNGKSVLFINNGIHPGEPCGIDATMVLVKELLTDKNYFKFLENTVLVIIPVYNIGGAKNRNTTSRVNQNGPLEHGFRGNAKNLDLNRDFIKCDSKNAESFHKLFTKWNPDVFIDTHTSNGSDYQHIITLIPTQKDKLAPSLGSYLEFDFLPKIYSSMAEDGYAMSPYVNSMGSTPDEKGIMAFPDLPRYSTGYAAMHHSLGFMPETHMLKTYNDRVLSTKTFLLRMTELVNKEGVVIQEKRQEAVRHYMNLKRAPIQWKLDKEIVITTLFKGYESGYKPSEISGEPRLYYDREKPINVEIPFYNSYETSHSIALPQSYIIPQAYAEIIERLEWNNVIMTRLKVDVEIDVEMYYIEKYETTKVPYESHYLHYNTEIKRVDRKQKFFKGDYIVALDQVKNRFIIETLEPEAPDSYFSWNFFDGILMQKEYFSDYVFEDLAVDILSENEELKKSFELKKREDDAFSKNAKAQLDYIYKNSPHHEPTYMLYPIGRVF